MFIILYDHGYGYDGGGGRPCTFWTRCTYRYRARCVSFFGSDNVFGAPSKRTKTIHHFRRLHRGYTDTHLHRTAYFIVSR